MVFSFGVRAQKIEECVCCCHDGGVNGPQRLQQYISDLRDELTLIESCTHKE